MAGVLAACGGSRDLSHETVAQVGDYAVTKTLLNQWMTEKVGEDFYEITAHEAPSRLVSEPADYAACVAVVKSVPPFLGKGKPRPRLTPAQLTGKCRELYEGVREQALAYLVSSYWSINFDAAHGLKVSDEEVQQKLKRIKAEQFRPDGKFHQLLANTKRTLPQELFIIKMDLLQQKLLEKLQAMGQQQSAPLVADARKAVASANCLPGYVVEHCKGYAAPKASARLSPAALIEEIVQ
jgi:hypothetical protein